MSTLFGRSYTSIGESSNDLLLKTRGQIKIQWGNKFIDLIKDGKLNYNDKLINSVTTVQDISTSKNGIYYVEEDSSLWVVIGGNLLNIKDSTNTYVSFLEKQTTTGDQKHTALTNIGFLYPSIEQAKLANLTSGIVYIEDQKKLYIIAEGQLIEYSLTLPNPYTNQLTIRKSDQNRGALVIQGEGENNSLIIEDIIIFSDDNSNIINSQSQPLSIQYQGQTAVQIDDQVNVYKPTYLQSGAYSNTVASVGATDNNGFRLYISGGQSFLEVDTIIERNGSENTNIIIPVYWAAETNIIKSVQELNIENQVQLTLLQQNTYQVGDTLYVYLPTYIQENAYYQIQTLSMSVVSLTDNSITVEVLSTSANLDDMQQILVGQTTFLIARTDQKTNIIRFSQDNIDLIETQTASDEQDLSKINTRIGDINSLNKSILVQQDNIKGSIQETIVVPTKEFKQGVFSNNLVTDNSEQFNANLYGPVFKGGPELNIFPRYEDGLQLPVEDSSQIVVTSNWVKTLLQQIIPQGTIVGWSGTTIPEGWALCDGQNGTPDLTSLFLKNTQLQLNDSDSRVINPSEYLLVYIIKLSY